MCENPKPFDWFRIFYVYHTGCSGQVKLPETVEARLLTRTINGKERQVLTSMIDPMRFPGADIVERYSHRWEIELGFFGK